MFGRERELDELSALADAAARGKGGVVLVEGEAGIGKTQLVTATLTRAETSGFAAFRAAAEALERGRPFGVVADALELHPRSDDPERAEIGRLLTGEPSPDETSNPYADPTFRIIESVGAILERLASKRPVAVALEDLHWADVSTLGAVVSLARRFAAMPVLMLLTMRPSPRSHDLDGAVERLWSRGARQLRLSPLPDDAVVALTAEVATAAPGPSLLRQVRGASGNPLYVIELVRALRDAGALRVAGGVAESDETPLPSTLRETILRRLSFLPADALELLRLASVLGSTFAADDLAAVAGQPARDLLTRLQEPVRAGVIGEAGGALAFRHELIRAAVYDDIPGTIRSRLHREAAEALATAGASPARVGEQLALAGDPEAVPWLRRAARHAASRSPLVATDLLRRALDLAAFDHPKREAMTSELLTSLVIVGRMAEVEPLARDILARDPPPLLEASIRSNLANALLYREIRPDAAREQFARAAAVADIPDWLASWNVALAALVQATTGDVDGAEVEARAALEVGERVAFPHTICCALAALSFAAAARGDLARAVELGTRSVEVERHSGDTPWAGYLFSNFWFSVVLVEADQFEEAERAIGAGRRRAEALQAALVSGAYGWSLATTKMFAGALDDARAEAEAALALCEETGRRLDALFCLSVLASVAMLRGDLDTAQALCAQAESLLEGTTFAGPLDTIRAVQAVALDAHGDEPAALALLQEAWDRAAGRSVFPAYRLAAPLLVRLASSHGDRDRARAVVDHVEEFARRAGTPAAEGMALRCAGIFDHDASLLLAAVETYRRGPRPFERAFACEDAAAALARDGRTSEARALFDEALDVYEHAGAPLQAARAAATMRRLGIHPGSRKPRGRPATGWGAVTDSEQRVVALVAQGLTNAQVAQQLFISRYTVETHLKHVFQKLSVTSRTELAAVAARHREADT